MSVWVIIAMLSGAINIINKMINLEAKKRLGISNGTLLNYFEATILSFILVCIFYKNSHLNVEFLKEIPLIYFLGGFLGLLSMIFVMIGMSHLKVIYATIFILLGQLGSGYIVDSIIKGKFNYANVVGIIFILIGVLYDKKIESLHDN